MTKAVENSVKEYVDLFKEKVKKWFDEEPEIRYGVTEVCFDMILSGHFHMILRFDWSLEKVQGIIEKKIHKTVGEAHLDDLSDEKQMFQDLSQPLIELSYELEEAGYFEPEITSKEFNLQILIFADSYQNAEDVVLYKNGSNYKGFLQGKGLRVPISLQFGENQTFDETIRRLNSLGDFNFYLKDQRE